MTNTATLHLVLFAFAAILVFSGCVTPDGETGGRAFDTDVAFLKKHTDVLVLSDDAGNAQLAVVPAYQGRVMTSTAGGGTGTSFGWINRELIASGELQPHINVFGGEDRFWVGPEGGQYSVFFKRDTPFDLEHWQTPAPIDTEPYALVRRTTGTAEFEHRFRLTNYSGAVFETKVERAIQLLPANRVGELVGEALPKGVSVVGYESVNRLRNVGTEPWRRQSGLLSVWILGMFNPSPATVIALPIRRGAESDLGPRVNADYFGDVPPERLVVEDDAIFFKGDGTYRSKIGVGPRRAKPVMGSFDDQQNVLTVVQFTLPGDTESYVNSAWELQDAPYGGDVVNSYNDGPPAPGTKPLGPFYELESSSPAVELAPGQAVEHVHRTLHFQGEEAALNPIAVRLLGVGIDRIKTMGGRAE